MKQRILTSILLISLCSLIFILGNTYIIGLLSIIILLSSYELGKLLFNHQKHIIISSIINITLFILSLKFSIFWQSPLTYILLTLSWIIFFIEIKQQSLTKNTLLHYLKSIILISFSFPYILLILNKSQPIFLILLLCIIIWTCDTFSLIIGKKIGKRPLSSASPNKTIEGSIGGIISSCLCASLFLYSQSELNLPFISLSLIINIVIQIGDLYESRLKRYSKVKDSSNLLPGHGGILDRCDSFLIGLPAYYILLTLLGL